MKRKTLLLTVGLVGVLCYGCGKTASTEQTPVVEESTSTDEAVAQEEAEPEEETQEVEEAEPETETVYLVSKETFYDQNNEIKYEYTYEYNDFGKKLECTIKRKDDGDLKTTYEYYEDGTLKSEISLNADGSLNYSHEYNADGTEAVYKRNFEYGNSDKVYTYENGLLVSSVDTHYDSDGNISMVWENKYDEFGHESSEKSTFYGNEDTMEGEWEDIENKYDSQNRLIESKQPFGDAGYNVEKFEYDNAGNTILDLYESYDSDGNITMSSKITFTFDEFNNVIYSADYDDNGEIKEYYDIKNNYDNDNNLIGYVETDKDGNVVDSYEAEYIKLELPKTE